MTDRARPLAGASFPYFFASFVSASLQSVIPQHQLAVRPDHERFLLLSTCLLLGAVGSLAGIWASRRLEPVVSALATHRWRLLALLLSLALGLAFSGTLWISTSLAYVACFFVVNGLSQLLFDTLDRRLVRRAGPGLDDHVRGATALQLVGFVSGPVWFGALAGARVPHFVVIAVLVAILASVAWRLPYDHLKDASKGERGRGPSTAALQGIAWERDDVMFFLFGFLTYAAMFVFISSFLYVVKDHYGRADAAMIAGGLLGASNVVAALTVFVARRMQIRVDDGGQGFGAGLHLPTTAVMLVCLVVVGLRPSTSVLWLVACALPTGACYGLFLLRARSFASRRATVPGRDGFLSTFNNLSNAAALFAFCAMLGIAELCRRAGLSHVIAAITASGALATAALVVLAIARRWQQRARR